MKAPDKKDFRPRIPAADRAEVFAAAKAIGMTPTAYVHDVVMRSCREEPGHTASQKHLAEFRTLATRIACAAAVICTRSAFLMRRVESATSNGSLLDAYRSGQILDAIDALQVTLRKIADLLRELVGQPRPAKARTSGTRKTEEARDGN